MLALRALYVSKDKPALKAAYGDASLVAHEDWLSHLKAGGNAAELMRMLNFAGVLGELSGAGMYNGARRLHDALGPVSFAVLALAAFVGWQWVRDPKRQGFRDGLMKFGEFGLAIGAMQHDGERHFDRALPGTPTWNELASTNERDSVLGRACLYTLAREPQGEMSAQELAGRVAMRLDCTDARVRALLRVTSCFDQVRPGRWQVGAVAPGYEIVAAD